MIISPVDDKERQSLEKFKVLTDDLKQDEETLLRFLRAREHNHPKAETMLRNSMKWRAERNFGSVLTWSIPKLIEEDMIFEWTGSDNEGRPVLWLPMGSIKFYNKTKVPKAFVRDIKQDLPKTFIMSMTRWNTREIIEKGHKDEVVDFVYFLLETIMYKLKQANCSQVTFIYGMEQLTMWKVANISTMQVLYNAFRDLEENYPEIIKTIYVINAPWAFSVAFNVIKPILSAHTIGKFQIYNTDQKKWLEVLKANIPESAIPAEYRES